jgi:hypothetical protein
MPSQQRDCSKQVQNPVLHFFCHNVFRDRTTVTLSYAAEPGFPGNTHIHTSHTHVVHLRYQCTNVNLAYLGRNVNINTKNLLFFAVHPPLQTEATLSTY